MTRVSVPCRGLNLYTEARITVRRAEVFPSPVGDLIYIREFFSPLSKEKIRVSVPCRGLNLYT